MSNPVVEVLFLLAFWAPPVTVVVCALLLFVKEPSPQPSKAQLPAVAVMH